MIEIVGNPVIAGAVDLEAERRTVSKYNQRVEIVHGVPVYYPKAEDSGAASKGIPPEEVQRRERLIFQTNTARWLDQ